MKGQGSTEYLVILAVVLVVALIVIGLLGGFTGFGVSGQEQQSQAYWKGVSPFSIQNALVSDGTGVAFEMQNRDTKKLVLTQVKLDGASILSANTTFAGGQTILVSNSTIDTTAFGCDGTGSTYVIKTIAFTYATMGGQAISGITQTGDKSLQGKCA